LFGLELSKKELSYKTNEYEFEVEEGINLNEETYIYKINNKIFL